MARTIGYRWHLRRLMADKDMYATTQLRPLLAERGVVLSREQVYRLVTGVPERLSLATLAALCDILGCGPGDLVEPVAGAGAGGRAAAGPVPRPAGRCPGRCGPGCPARPAGSGRGWPAARQGTSWPGRCSAAARAAAGTRWSRQSQRRTASLPGTVIAAAVDAAAPSGQALRQPGGRRWPPIPAALAAGAPPVAGRLAAELIARGSATLTVPACAVCGRAGKPLFRGDGGGVCQRCRTWQLAAACAVCGKVKPVCRPGRDGQPVCEVCRRRDDPRRHRACGRCGKTAPVAVARHATASRTSA